MDILPGPTQVQSSLWERFDPYTTHVLLSTPSYTILTNKASIWIQFPSQESQASGLLQKIEQALRNGCWPTSAAVEIERKLKVLEALRGYGTFSAYFSRRLSDTYARKGDYLLCFFADFEAFQSSPFASAWRVRVAHVPAFTEQFGNVYLIHVRKEVSKKLYWEFREVGGLCPIAEGEIFHFLLLHETYHYLQACFYRDLRSEEVGQSVPFAIQEYNANRWALDELRGFLRSA